MREIRKNVWVNSGGGKIGLALAVFNAMKLVDLIKRGEA